MKHLLFLALFLFLLVGCRPSGETVPAGDAGVPVMPITAPLPTVDAALVSLGAAVYVDACAECHGEKLEGEPNWQERNADDSFRAPPHDASGHTWHHSDRVLREAIWQGGARLDDLPGVGTSNMPAYADVLSEREVEAVLAYIKSAWPEDIRAIQWEQTLNDPGPQSGN